MKKGLFCIGGPNAGEYITGTVPKNYCHWLIENTQCLAYWNELNTTASVVERLFYGYEQHCKAVAERNKAPVDQPSDNILLEGVLLKDFYTASFLRSCKTVIIPSPIGETQPLTLTYGKSYIGYLNDSMEFVMPLLVIEDESMEATSEKNLGRIGTPICIVP